MRYMWHATEYKNLVSILDNGIIPGPDKLVYLCENGIDAAKFVAVRGCRDILLCQIKIYKADEDKIKETFDHSERFFKCRAFGYKGAIKPQNIKHYRRLEI